MRQCHTAHNFFDMTKFSARFFQEFTPCRHIKKQILNPDMRPFRGCNSLNFLMIKSRTIDFDLITDALVTLTADHGQA